MMYHDDMWCGMCRDDCTLIGKKVKNWKLPGMEESRSHVLYMKSLIGKLD